MKAYFVHDARKALDHIVIPEMDALVKVDRTVMEGFIGVAPQFVQWEKNALNGLMPQSFGCVIATRDDEGDVCVEDSCIWPERLQYYLG